MSRLFVTNKTYPSFTYRFIYFILLLNMYCRDLLCFFINIFPKKMSSAQHACFWLCLAHKVQMAQNIIFKGKILLQIYIPMYMYPLPPPIPLDILAKPGSQKSSSPPLAVTPCTAVPLSQPV